MLACFDRPVTVQICVICTVTSAAGLCEALEGPLSRRAASLTGS